MNKNGKTAGEQQWIITAAEFTRELRDTPPDEVPELCRDPRRGGHFGVSSAVKLLGDRSMRVRGNAITAIRVLGPKTALSTREAVLALSEYLTSHPKIGKKPLAMIVDAFESLAHSDYGIIARAEYLRCMAACPRVRQQLGKRHAIVVMRLEETVRNLGTRFSNLANQVHVLLGPSSAKKSYVAEMAALLDSLVQRAMLLRQVRKA